MKKTNKGFTLVELIIVIAVIGILAAILIPVFANVIDKANRKSAFSDAKNALSIYIAEVSDGQGGAIVTEGSVFEVDKADQKWYFIYQNNGLVEAAEDDTIHNFPTNASATAASSTYTATDVPNLPENVIIYMA